MAALGTLLKEVGNLTAALPVLEEALASLRTVAGPKDALTLDVMHRLAMLHFYARRLPRAKALLMEATAGLSETCGARHPDTLETVANHGRLFHEEGHAAGALPLLTEALAGRRAALGEDHPETIDSMGQLGALQQCSASWTRQGALLRRTHNAQAAERVANRCRSFTASLSYLLARQPLSLHRTLTRTRTHARSSSPAGAPLRAGPAQGARAGGRRRRCR